jgi:hypothetical protein
MNRAFGAVFATIAVLASSMSGAAGRSDEPVRRQTSAVAEAPAGVPEMVNFEHVYNYTPVADTLDPNGKGTDHEFFTAQVPKRDYTTGLLVDAEGKPLGGGQPPVMVTRDFAIMGSYGGGAWIFDITDPEAVQFVRNIPCNQTQNDIQIKQFGTRWVLVLARDGSAAPCVDTAAGGTTGAGLAVFDITDPYAFQPMYNFRTTGGAHNFTFHPTKPVGWVSTGDLPGGPVNHIPIIDFTNVDAPVLAADIPYQGGGPHDIVFSADGLRAFVAGENNFRIFDTTDPLAPVIVNSSLLPNQGTYAHGFDPTPDRKLAVTTNESLVAGGFFGPNTAVCPGEGLNFYRIEGNAETNPVKLNSAPFLADVQGPSATPGDDRACTGHVGKLGNKAMTLGWYIGGVRVVDYSNPAAPTEIGVAVMPGTEVWSAKWYKGPYVYASDMRRGFDVYRWTGAQPPPWTDGVPIPDPTAPSACGKPTLVGGAGDSVLTGTAGNDVIVDMDGNNVIRGGGGNDKICTGPGNDDIKTEKGADVVIDKGGNNKIKTGGGRDTVTSGKGRDVIRTAGGRDRVTSKGGKDKVNGGGGKDTLRTGGGKDTVVGGGGRDKCKAGGGKNTLRGCP